MKTKNSIKFLSLIAILLFIGTRTSFAQTKGKKTDSLRLADRFLKFTCKITTKNKLTNPVDIILYSNNKVISHTILDKKLKFEYFFKRDSSYILQISAPFYVTRYVVINTTMPKKMKQEGTQYIHDMDMELMEQPKAYYTPDVNSDILDEPITIIRYLSQTDAFNVDPKYTRKMKRELRMFQKNIDKLTSTPPQKN